MIADGRGRVLGVGEGERYRKPKTQEDELQSENAFLSAIREAQVNAGEVDLNSILAIRVAAEEGPTEAARIVAHHLPYARLVSDGLGSSLLASVTFGEPGIVVYGGNGSMAYAQCPEGRELSIGGWGPDLGDEGSALWVVRKALNALTQAADGRAERTSMMTPMLRHWRVPNLTGLRQQLDQEALSPGNLASVVPLVGQAARDGDPAAYRILGRAGRELGQLAVAALQRLDLYKSRVTVGMAGSVFACGLPVVEAFQQTIFPVAPQTEFTGARVPLVIGALLLALKDLEILITPEMRERLEAAEGLIPV